MALLDFGMPRMDGFEAARAIRREDWGRNLPWVALTGWGQAEDKARTRQVGFDRHLTKRVELDELQHLRATLLPSGRAAARAQPATAQRSSGGRT